MNRLKIVFASPEAVPFAKTGGLADVAGALPRALAELGYEVKLFLPKYGHIHPSHLESFWQDLSLEIPIGGMTHPLDLYRRADPDLPLEYFLIGNDHFFDRPQLYVDPKTNRDYRDNDERFIFLCRGILESLKALKYAPDIIHANDWQTALLPTFLRTAYSDDPMFAATKSIFTIHNMGYQGLFPAEVFAKLDLPETFFYPTGPFEFWGKLNLMKAAISYADRLNTVSPRYAEEIQTTDEYGCGLEGVLRGRRKYLSGILNGADYDEWSPKGDRHIPYKYSIANFAGKRRNKVELLGRLSLPMRDTAPLVGMISRLVDQKGFDLIAEVADEIFELNLQMVVLGLGDSKYHEFLQKLQLAHPDKLRLLLTYDNEMAHLIEASSDIFLMPSRYEPCGLNQMYSLRYGTVPIVRETGGLADSIADVSPDGRAGTGFMFRDYDSSEMLAAIKRALSFFVKKRLWRRIAKEGMEKDFSWTQAAIKYANLYANALADDGGRT